MIIRRRISFLISALVLTVLGSTTNASAVTAETAKKCAFLTAQDFSSA